MDTQDADQKRQENTTDAGPEVSVFLRKAVGTWSTCVPLHIPVMGSPSDSPVSIFIFRLLFMRHAGFRLAGREESSWLRV